MPELTPLTDTTAKIQSNAIGIWNEMNSPDGSRIRILDLKIFGLLLLLAWKKSMCFWLSTGKTLNWHRWMRLHLVTARRQEAEGRSVALQISTGQANPKACSGLGLNEVLLAHLSLSSRPLSSLGSLCWLGEPWERIHRPVLAAS